MLFKMQILMFRKMPLPEFVDVISGGDLSLQASGEITFADETATAANVDEIIKDIVDRKGGARIRVDRGA